MEKECLDFSLVLYVQCKGESVDHLLLNCSIVTDLWSEVLGFLEFVRWCQRLLSSCQLVGKDILGFGPLIAWYGACGGREITRALKI